METTAQAKRLGYRLIKMSSNLVHHVTRMSTSLQGYLQCMYQFIAKCDLNFEREVVVHY